MFRSLKIVVGLLLICFVVEGFYCTASVAAMSCQDIIDKGEGYNQSLYNACNKQGSSRGTMWISSYESGDNLEAVVNYDNITTGYITVYLHGATITDDGGVDSNATCIKVFEGDRMPNDNPSDGMTCDAGGVAYNDKVYSYIELISDGDGSWGLPKDSDGPYMYRIAVSRNNGDIKSSVGSIKLDIGSIISESVGYMDEDSRWIHEVKLNVFRCWSGNEGTNSCYSDQSVLKIRTPTFLGSSRAMTRDVDWSDSMVADGTGVQYDAAHRWKPEGGASAGDYTVGDTLVIPDCDFGSGCKVTFRHYMKRAVGSEGEAYYKITRFGDSNSATPSDEKTSGLTAVGKKIRKDELDTITMYPGQKVCEKLEFNIDGSALTNDLSKRVTSTVCAVAVGGEGSDISMEIKNDSSTVDQSWHNDYVYARPDDKVKMKGTYAPYYQRWYTKSLTGMDSNIGESFNSLNNPGWNNAFSAKIGYETLDSASCAGDTFGVIGKSVPYENEFDRDITVNDVGGKLVAKAVTNCNNDTKNTPKKVEVTYNDRGNGNGEFNANVDIDPIESNAVEVRVPYNFVNNVDIDEVDGNYVSAGEIIKIPSTVITSRKINGLVGGDPYATVVENARLRVRMCADKDCFVEYSKSEKEIGRLHDGVDKFADSSKDIKGDESPSISVPDLPAGTEIYVSVDVYPAESDDNKWNDEKGNGKWSDPKQVKVTVTKSPSFQVWGGDVFVKENINIPLASKAVLDGYNSDVLPRKFGSWGELSVEIGSDGNRGNLFSGAALGFAGNNDGKLSPNYSFPLEGGSTSGYQGLGNNELNIGDPGGRAINDTDFDNKGDLNYSGGSGIIIDEFVNKISKKIGNDDKKEVGGDSKIGDLESEDLNFGPNAKKMYVSDGDIIINKDIMYSGEYETLESIPKIVIYADNIKIDCSVERIDAVLIAKRNIQTCDNIYTNSAKASVQLRINGAMIAGETVKFKRNYGAGTGANSMIPAEIINMDPSWYLWAADSIGISGTSVEHDDTEGLMIPTYTCELPPRY